MAARPGIAVFLARTGELVFTEAVRHYVQELPDQTEGWLGALRDRSVSKALALMYQAPDKARTAADLGYEVGASRSTLNAKFVRYMGMPPGEFLNEVRMQLAARELQLGQDNIAGQALTYCFVAVSSRSRRPSASDAQPVVTSCKCAGSVRVTQLPVVLRVSHSCLPSPRAPGQMS